MLLQDLMKDSGEDADAIHVYQAAMSVRKAMRLQNRPCCRRKHPAGAKTDARLRVPSVHSSPSATV